MRLKQTKENCIVFTDASTHKIIYLSFSKISASPLFLKLFLKFRKFQPR